MRTFAPADPRSAHERGRFGRIGAAAVGSVEPRALVPAIQNPGGKLLGTAQVLIEGNFKKMGFLKTSLVDW